MTERLIVFDSYFGNTAKVAEAIGEAIGATVKRVYDIRPEDFEGLKLFFIGSPTRAFRPTQKAQSLLQSHKGKLAGVRGSVFDTRIPIDKTYSDFLKFMIRLFGYADAKMAKAYQKTGATLALEPTGFAVLDSEGPLTEGEMERATNWAEAIL